MDRPANIVESEKFIWARVGIISPVILDFIETSLLKVCVTNTH